VAWWQIAAVFVISTAIGVSPQFTPFAVAGAIGLLVLWGVLRSFWRGLLLCVALAGPAVIWALLHFDVIKQFISPDQVGNASNFSTPKTASAPGVSRLPIVFQSSVALLAALVIIGLIAFIGSIKLIRNRTTLGIASAAIFAFALIVVTPYGNEGVFRASLFALPWLVILGLPVYRRMARGGRLLSVLLALVLAAQTAAYLVSSAGLDASNVARPADVAVYDYVSRLAGEHPDTTYAVIQIGPGDMPTNRSVALPEANYFRSTTAIGPLPTELDGQLYLHRCFQITYRLLYKPKKLVEFVIYSPASIAYTLEYGQATAEALKNIRAALFTDPEMHVVTVDDGTVLARVDPSVPSASG